MVDLLLSILPFCVAMEDVFPLCHIIPDPTSTAAGELLIVQTTEDYFQVQGYEKRDWI